VLNKYLKNTKTFQFFTLTHSPFPSLEKKKKNNSVRTAGSLRNKMAAARCVRGLWTDQVLSMKISTRLTAQPASLFSSESGKILRESRTFSIFKMALYQPYCSLW